MAISKEGGRFHSVLQSHMKHMNLLIHALHAQQCRAVMWRAEWEQWDKRNLELWHFDKTSELWKKTHTYFPTKASLSTLYLMKHT